MALEIPKRWSVCLIASALVSVSACSSSAPRGGTSGSAGSSSTGPTASAVTGSASGGTSGCSNPATCQLARDCCPSSPGGAGLLGCLSGQCIYQTSSGGSSSGFTSSTATVGSTGSIGGTSSSGSSGGTTGGCPTLLLCGSIEVCNCVDAGAVEACAANPCVNVCCPYGGITGADGGTCPYWPPKPCNSVIECTCADGTVQLGGCAGPPTCEDACCGHGGVAPSTTGSTGASGSGTYACGDEPGSAVRCTSQQYCTVQCFGPTYECEPIPAACSADPSCGCIADAGVPNQISCVIDGGIFVGLGGGC